MEDFSCEFRKGSLFFSPSNNVFLTLHFSPPSKPFFSSSRFLFSHSLELFFLLLPSQNLLFLPCSLSFSPCSRFLSPFALFFSPFTLSFSPSALSFQPSAGEAGIPWNLHKERRHLRFVSHRLSLHLPNPLFSPQKFLVTSPSEPSGNCVKTVRNGGNRRKSIHPSMHPSVTECQATNQPSNNAATGEALRPPHLHSIRPSTHPPAECQSTDQPTKQQRGQANKPTKQPTNQATKTTHPVALRPPPHPLPP